VRQHLLEQIVELVGFKPLALSAPLSDERFGAGHLPAREESSVTEPTGYTPRIHMRSGSADNSLIGD
jgi:hypothetical protein